MKALLVSAAAIGLFAATPAFAQAGPSATANANADAEIVTPIAINNVDGLSFGRIAAGDGGTVTVNADGSLTSSSPNMVIAGSTGNAATFNVTGGASLAYTATIPATATLAGPGGNLTATLTKNGGAATLNGSGADTFDVLGTLAVPAGTAAGAYAGSFTVSAAYN